MFNGACSLKNETYKRHLVNKMTLRDKTLTLVITKTSQIYKIKKLYLQRVKFV